MTFVPSRRGTWYENDFISQVKHLNDRIQPIGRECSDKVIIVPHAGLAYSGHVAIQAYSRVPWSLYRRVVILSTLHDNYKGLFIPSFSQVKYDEMEPLKIDKTDLPTIFQPGSENMFADEHSWEMQLPFLFYFRRDFKILPILVGAWNQIGKADLDSVVKTLNKLAKDHSTLFVITTDLTHYGKNYGFTPYHFDPKETMGRDMFYIEALFGNNPNAMKNVNACGDKVLKLWLKLPIVSELIPKMVDYGTSLDKKGKNIESDTNFVSYFAALWKHRKCTQDMWKVIGENMLNVPLTALLLFAEISHNINLERLSRNSLIEYWKEIKKTHKFSSFPEYTPIKGIFVTQDTRKDQRLMGCIGNFYDNAKQMANDEQFTLLDIVAVTTLETVFTDGRFPYNPLRQNKNLETLWRDSNMWTFKINFLEREFPIKPEEFWNKYKPGVHGITLSYGGQGATYLPSVMCEQNWIKCKSDTKTMSNSVREKFEKNTFGELFKKMGNEDINWEMWKNASISLYEGKEEYI